MSQMSELQTLRLASFDSETLQPPHLSDSPLSSPVIDLESQSPETQTQSSLTTNQEIQPLHPTTINPEMLLPPQIQAAPLHSTVEIELQQTLSATINPHIISVKKTSLQWPNIIMAFCFQAAIEIALQYEQSPHSILSVFFYLRSFAIFFTFASLFVSQLIRRRFPDRSKVLEKLAISFAAITFFINIATPVTFSLK